MKLEVEMTQEQLNLLILSTEVMDKSLYDVRASEPYHGGTEPHIKVKVIDKN
ncbi:MAG: hypothetical protein IJ796_05565 [Lachnospiraceae bacterium]|nr:hypothetical protein [Lachnospiraceae bacterium]